MARVCYVKSTPTKAQKTNDRRGPFLRRDMAHFYSAIDNQMAGTGPGASGGALVILRKSFLAAVTNPKGYLFVTAFVSQFLNASDPLLPQYVTLALIFIAADVAVMATYAGLGAKAIRFLSDRGALWIDRTCGSCLVRLGLALAFVRRSEV